MIDDKDDLNAQTVRDAALAWFTRAHAGDATPDDRLALQLWLASDPLHRVEYERLEAVWSTLDRMPDPRTRHRNGAAPVVSRRFFLGGAALAAAGGIVALSGLPDFVTSDHHTGTSELKTVTLADGSTVQLDAASALSVDFSPSSRSLVLQRGRAFFKVARDPARPFIVAAGTGSTTAMGTEFVVHMTREEVTVAVQESAVSVAASAAGTPASVDAGETVSYGPGGLGAVGKTLLESETAWRRGKLIFEDQPLGRVIADVNRYRTGTIRITDARLLDLRVSGIFDIGNPDGVLDAITQTLPVRGIALTRYLILLRPA
ncbi:MAG: FecR family protein [Phyllobacterium sp.]